MSGADDISAEFEVHRVLYQGSGLLVVDKPSGIPMHRGTGHDVGLVESLDAWASTHPGILDVRPGKPLHPINLLDQEASGVVMIGSTRAVARRAKEAIAAGRVTRKCLAVVAGPLDEEGTIQGKVRSRLRGTTRRVPASLHFRKLIGDDRLSLVEIVPGGGQPHLVRVLFAEKGRPLAGDTRYGKPGPCRKFLDKFGLPHLLLHVMELRIPGGIVGGALAFEAPIPELFKQLCTHKGWDDVLRPA